MSAAGREPVSDDDVIARQDAFAILSAYLEAGQPDGPDWVPPEYERLLRDVVEIPNRAYHMTLWLCQIATVAIYDAMALKAKTFGLTLPSLAEVDHGLLREWVSFRAAEFERLLAEEHDKGA